MRFHVLSATVFLCLLSLFAGAAQAGHPVGYHPYRHHPHHAGYPQLHATVMARIYNKSDMDIRFKIIPYAYHRKAYVVDLLTNYKSSPIPNLKKGYRAFVVFDLITNQALATGVFDIRQDVQIYVNNGPQPGIVVIEVKAMP